MLALFDVMCYIIQVKLTPAKKQLVRLGLYISRFIGFTFAGVSAREAGFLFSLVRNLNHPWAWVQNRLLSSDNKASVDVFQSHDFTQCLTSDNVSTLKRTPQGAGRMVRIIRPPDSLRSNTDREQILTCQNLLSRTRQGSMVNA